MAGTAVAGVSVTPSNSAEYRAIAALNQLIDDVEVLRAGLNAAAVELNKAVTDLASARTTVNAIITAAATDIAAVAAVTPLGAGTAAAVTRTTYDTAGDLVAPPIESVQFEAEIV